MERLSFRAKAVLISAVFSLPVVVLGVASANDFAEKYRFIRDELIGVDILRVLQPVNQQLTLARNATRAYLGGYDTHREYQQGLIKADGAFVKALEQLADIKDPFALQPQFKALQESWQEAKDAKSLTDESGRNTIFRKVTNDGVRLTKVVADKSGIILDPEIDTLYLGLLSIQVLPSMLQNLGQLRAWSTYLSAKADSINLGERNDIRLRYAIWDAQVRADLVQYAEYRDKILAHSPDLQARFDLDLPELAEKYRNRTFAVGMLDREDISADLWQSGGDIEQRIGAMQIQALDTLERLLRARLRALNQTHLQLAALAVLSILLAVYFFVSFYRGMNRDMAQQQQDEALLREAKVTAEKANAAKSEFLANMSHEIRTPMNGVIGMTDLALELANDPIQRSYLNTVKGSAASLLTILNDVLDFSKLEAGKFTIETVAFDLPETIKDTLKPLTARAAQKGLTMDLKLPADLPSSAMGDPGRLRQVLTNLCDNAIKFTSHGGVCIGVVSSLQQSGYVLHFSVEDTGIGIAKEKQDSVFASFAQADNSITRQFGGTGLGLTISSRLVELMGGKIWLNSVKGQGTTFHFTMPVQRVLQDAPEPMQVSSTTLVATTPMQVLLVEDHQVNQLVATTLLKKWGHSVVLAKNGQEAVELFPSQTWDVVLMDLQMPVMGGLEATRLIRASEPVGQRTPIVALSANAMESDRTASMAAGMDAHLSKPFTAFSLQEIMARYANQK